MYVLTVELAQTFARLKLFTRLNNTIYKKSIGCFLRKAAFFYFIATDKRKLHKKTVDFLFQEIAYRSIFSKIAYFNLANASLIRRIASTMFSSLVA